MNPVGGLVGPVPDPTPPGICLAPPRHRRDRSAPASCSESDIKTYVLYVCRYIALDSVQLFCILTTTQLINRYQRTIQQKITITIITITIVKYTFWTSINKSTIS
jgi:hypothetical protein